MNNTPGDKIAKQIEGIIDNPPNWGKFSSKRGWDSKSLALAIKKYIFECKPRYLELSEINSLSDDITYLANHESEIYNQALKEWQDNMERRKI